MEKENMNSNEKNRKVQHLAALAMALFIAMPALAAPLPVSPDDIPDLHDNGPAAEPLQTHIRLVGDPEGEWAIELTGSTDWGANSTSIQVWSPDGRAALAEGEEALRGRNLTTGKVWEAFNFEALDEGLAQVRLSTEIDGGDAYVLNNDYHLYFYRMFDVGSEPGEGVNLASLIGDALEEAGEDPTALPDRADAFYAWGSYGVAIDNMRGRCCNFSAMPDPPLGNMIPTSFVDRDGTVAPNLPPAIYEAVELVGAVEGFLPEPVRPSRILADNTNVTVTAPVSHQDGQVRTQGDISYKEPNTGDLDDSSGNSGRSVYISGNIRLVEPDSGTDRPCSYCSIDFYESDGSSRHDYFGSGSASINGYFSKWVRVADNEGAIDPYVQVGLTGTDRVTVADESGLVYYYNPGQAQMLNCSSTNCYLGAIYVDRNSPTGNYGYQELDIEDWDKGAMAYWWTTTAYGRFGSSIPNVQDDVVVRTPAEKPGTIADGQTHNRDTGHYDPATREIHLGSDQATTPNTVSHEYGHRLMHDLYGTHTPTGCPSPHYFNQASGGRCAWSEGWAIFWAIHGLYGVTRYEGGNAVAKTRNYFANGGWWDIETFASSGSWSFDQGVNVEGRVAAALWDLVDGSNDGESVDLVTETHVIPVLQHDASPTNGAQITFRAFYDDWRDHYGAGSTRAGQLRTVANHNTIDTTGWPT